jgi:hypothetical protein
MNNTSIKIHSTESLVFTEAAALGLNGPDAPFSRTTYFLYVFNTADPTSSTSNLYLIEAGSSDVISALVIKPGESAGFGPFRLDNLDTDAPDIYASGATTAVCTWVPVVSEK